MNFPRHSGELSMACGFTSLSFAILMFGFVMLGLLFASFAPLGLVLLLVSFVQARDASATPLRQVMGLWLLLLGIVLFAWGAWETVRFAHQLAIEGQRGPQFNHDFVDWLIKLGCWLLPSCLIGTGLWFWTAWPAQRRLGWCVAILAAPAAILILYLLLSHWLPISA
jgi:hypothetical protein